MSSIAIGTTPIEVLGGNAHRINASFANRSLGGQIIYFDNTTNEGLSSTNAGYVLAPGQSLNFVLLFDGEDIKLPWSFVSSAADGLLYYKEMSEHRKV